MEFSTVEENRAATEKLARVPAKVGTAVVQGTENLVRDGAQALTEAGRAVVEGAKELVVGAAQVG